MFAAPGLHRRTARRHRRPRLEAAAPRPGPDPRRDGRRDAPSRRGRPCRRQDRPRHFPPEAPMTTPQRFLFAITDGGGTVPADTSVVAGARAPRPRRARARRPRARAGRRGDRRRAHRVGDRSPAPRPRAAERGGPRLGGTLPVRRVRRGPRRADGRPGGPLRRRRARRAAPAARRRRRRRTASSSARRWAPRPRACRGDARAQPAVPPGLGHTAPRPRPAAGSRPARPRPRPASAGCCRAVFDKGLRQLNAVRAEHGWRRSPRCSAPTSAPTASSSSPRRRSTTTASARPRTCA